MRVLIDTHVLLWALSGDKRLSREALAVLSSFENEVFVSAASAWEIATKYRLGKLPTAAALTGNIRGVVEQLGFRPLSVPMGHAERAGALPGQHRDPFDRMLICQAMSEPLKFLTSNELLSQYTELVEVV